MKLFYILISITFFQFSSFSQNQFNENSKWYYEGGYFSFGSHFTYTTYSIDGDTVINTNEYWKIRINQIDSGFSHQFGETVNYRNGYYLALRELNNKVFVVFDGRTQEDLIFDYSLNIGDSINTLYGDCGHDNVIENITQVFLGSNTKKKFLITKTDKFFIEGIGSVNRFFGEFCQAIEGGESLVCYSDGKNVYSNDTNITCPLSTTVGINNHNSFAIQLFPNPSSNFIEIRNIAEVIEFEIYNSNGKKIKMVKNTSNKELLKINISDLEIGSYVLKSITNDNYSTQQFIKQ